KGHPFTTLTRFGQTDETGNQFNHLGGPQVQNRAIPGFTPEVLPTGVGYSKLTPPANTGLGYIDAVTDEEILSWADPDDLDNDGISGVANWVVMREYVIPRPGSIESNGRYMGRFGKKGAAYDLLQQTASAYNQDIGITSTYEPFDTHSGLATDPEVPDATIQNVVFYLKTLKAPVPRNTNSPGVAEGRRLFTDIGCAKCHRPEMRTGPSPVSALSEKSFYPYTDLLLHDMGAGLDDGYTEGSAMTSEWRTPPLWGLGLSKFSQGGQYYLLHDGRARSIEEAILLHGGEAENTRDNYAALPDGDRKDLIQFLESL
ncbi:MAG: c-type cytochrome, partial [Bacteroidota bacterium]|nr:c-type cytochrome [Bacteroidota bacterium]